jgi:hypothetical protein
VLCSAALRLPSAFLCAGPSLLPSASMKLRCFFSLPPPSLLPPHSLLSSGGRLLPTSFLPRARSRAGSRAARNGAERRGAGACFRDASSARGSDLSATLFRSDFYTKPLSPNAPEYGPSPAPHRRENQSMRRGGGHVDYVNRPIACASVSISTTSVSAGAPLLCHAMPCHVYDVSLHVPTQSM